MPPLVSTIREIRNRSGFSATIRNLATASDTDRGLGDLAAGETRSLAIDIPWCSDGKDYDKRHIIVTAGPPNMPQRFALWQHTSLWQTSHDGDRVQVSIDGAWSAAAQEIGGYASVNAVGDDRVLVITDTFLWLLPIKSPVMSTIVEVRNASRFPASVRNLAKPLDTAGGRGDCPPSASRTLGTLVPWNADAAGFAGNRIDVTVGPKTFSLWQAMQTPSQMRIRVSTDGAWHPDADEVGVYAAVGPIEGATLGDDRVLVINDDSLWLFPRILIDPLEDVARSAARDAFQICADNDPRTKQTPPFPVPSNPKLSATAFSMAGIVSDLFDDGQPNPQHRYRDSGKRYEFTIAQGGGVTVQPAPRAPALTETISYGRLRRGEPIPMPEFDLIAANGGRVFAKEKGVDRFYFAVIDHEFVHGTPSRKPFTVPTVYFKLDPEFNQRPPEHIPGANVADLMAHLDGDFAHHPAAIRFPLFRMLFGLQLAAAMAVNVKRGAWHLIDARPTLENMFGPVDAKLTKVVDFATSAKAVLHGQSDALAALDALLAWIAWIRHWLAQFLDDKPPGDTGYPHVAYCHTPSSLKDAVWQQSIGFSRVLDIGVGHVHYHQQYEGITGGELQMLRAPSDPIWFFDHPKVYQFLNGPVRDPDGFNDGTCNYYALVALRDGGPYGLLYLDEQSLFSPRWRFADPSDSNGTVVTLAADLAMTPSRYQWDKDAFWSPFRDAGAIGPRSRLAVSAQVMLVSADAAPLIFSVNFSWGTMDRTWRWRPLPVPASGLRYFPEPVDGREVIALESGDTVYPQTIRLRDDMTIHLKGCRNNRKGHWFQRYLPASNELAGAPSGSRPADGYTHEWKFVSDDAFRFADGYSHFGIYDSVDSRTQYYPVDPASFAVLDAANIAPDDWWADGGNQLVITAYTFRIDKLILPWPPILPPPTAPRKPSSLYNDTVLLRFVKRGTRWIALRADKRDDDMELYDARPEPVTLERRGRDGSVRDGSVTVTLQRGVLVDAPPAVQTAYFWWDAKDPALAGIAFGARAANVFDNVSRIRMAAFDGTGAATLLDLSVEAFRYSPTGGVYEHRWTPSPADAVLLRRFGTSDAQAQFGTSIWFEDVSGHAAPPDRIVWTAPLEMRVTVDPAEIPLGIPVTVTVRAFDASTGTEIPHATGTVVIDEVPTGHRLGETFSHTFTPIQEAPDLGGDGLGPKLKPQPPRKPHDPSGIVTGVDGYPDAAIPFHFFVPELDVSIDRTAFVIGQPAAFTVVARERHSSLRALLQAQVFVAGAYLGDTNPDPRTPSSRFTHTFGGAETTGTVSKAGYPPVALTFALTQPPPPPVMKIAVDPATFTPGKKITVTVHANEATAPYARIDGGAILINGQAPLGAPTTNVPFSYNVPQPPKPKVIGKNFKLPPPDPVDPPPVIVTVTKPGYQSATIDVSPW